MTGLCRFHCRLRLCRVAGLCLLYCRLRLCRTVGSCWFQCRLRLSTEREDSGFNLVSLKAEVE